MRTILTATAHHVTGHISWQVLDVEPGRAVTGAEAAAELARVVPRRGSTEELSVLLAQFALLMRRQAALRDVFQVRTAARDPSAPHRAVRMHVDTCAPGGSLLRDLHVRGLIDVVDGAHVRAIASAGRAWHVRCTRVMACHHSPLLVRCSGNRARSPRSTHTAPVARGW